MYVLTLYYFHILKKVYFLFIYVKPSPFVITATSIGPPTVSIEKDIFLIIDVIFNKDSAICANSVVGKNSTISIIGSIKLSRL